MLLMLAIKICFISLNINPLYQKNSTGYFGGAEVQMSLLAKELTKDKRFAVSIIARKNGPKIYQTNLFNFFSVLKKVDADVYVERTINPKIVLDYLYCRFYKKKFIYMIAHDWDVQHWSIMLADLVITQTAAQQKKLKAKTKSLVLPSLAYLPKCSGNKFKENILWVGRADSWKNPLAFIDIVKKNPREKFTMICRRGINRKLFKAVVYKAKILTNLKFIPAVAFDKVGTFFHEAKLLVNTSTAEGFPNTFLQAGLARTPIWSLTVNPDNYLNKFNCGFVGSKNLSAILKNSLTLQKMGRNHFEYVTQHHRHNQINQFKKAIIDLCLIKK